LSYRLTHAVSQILALGRLRGRPQRAFMDPILDVFNTSTCVSKLTHGVLLRVFFVLQVQLAVIECLKHGHVFTIPICI